VPHCQPGTRVFTSDSVITRVAAHRDLVLATAFVAAQTMDVEFGMLSKATCIGCVAPNPAVNLAALAEQAALEECAQGAVVVAPASYRVDMVVRTLSYRILEVIHFNFIYCLRVACASRHHVVSFLSSSLFYAQH
jgi:hypothetical protein